MRFSEIILRVGMGLVAWMVVVAYFLWLATAGRVGCEADGDAIFALLMGFGPAAAAIAFLLGATAPLPDVHRMLRWVAIVPALLVIPASYTLLQVFNTVNRAGESLCAAAPPPTWQIAWVPVQLACAGTCIYLMVRNWRRDAQ